LFCGSLNISLIFPMKKKDTNLFTILTQVIVVILPFYVLLAIFFTNIIWISNFGFFIKELLIISIFFSLIYEFFKAKKLPQFDILDYLVFFYIIYGVLITFINWLWLNSVIHWWRYDFMFLIVMLIYKHGEQFLKIKTKRLLKLFLYSGVVALFFSFCLKFRFKEELLMEFWYIDYISSRVYSGWIPIYHWLENSGIRRFQWIFDWPNAMAFFLVLFSGVFLYLQKKKNEFYVFLVMGFLFWLLILTYSRSALLWVFASILLTILLNFKYIFTHYKKAIIFIGIFGLIFLSIFWILFQDQLKNIVLRKSSTSGHFDRMIMWIKRFTNKPFWAWLAESWPGYRYIYPDKQTKEDELVYIPESWFIQILIEWWIFYFLAFVAILWIALKRVYKNSVIIFWILSAIIIMNMFLHIFEITYLSILIFIFTWLMLKNN
jgi:hypothetical protein